MINLRYHIISITAIFLALGIGVALGSTFLDKATVDQLETNIARAEKRIDDTRAKSRQLQTQVDQANRRDEALKALGSQELFVGMLRDDPVVVITYDGTDKQSLSTLTDTLIGADADLLGTLTIDSGFLADGDRTADRAKCIDLPESSSEGTVRRSIAERLGDALVGASRSTGQAPPDEDSATTTTALPRSPDGEPEIITQLRACGLLSYTPPEGGSEDDPVLVGSDNRYVFASNAAPPVSDDTLLMPMLRHQVEQRPSTALVVESAAVDDDPEATRTTVVGPIRRDDDLSAATSTVDDLESFSGVAATVLALRDVDRDVYGHYGVGGGATAQLPPGT